MTGRDTFATLKMCTFEEGLAQISLMAGREATRRLTRVAGWCLTKDNIMLDHTAAWDATTR